MIPNKSSGTSVFHGSPYDDEITDTVPSYTADLSLDNIIYGYEGNDVICGYWGDDTIFGGPGDDEINGDIGDDIIIGGPGADLLNGDLGNNTLSYEDSNEGVVVNLITGFAAGGDTEGDDIETYSFSNLTGSSHDDVLIGASVLAGLGGDDVLIAGSDSGHTLLGGEGNDTMNGGGGADLFIGGWGIDTVSYIESSAGVFVSLVADTASGGDAEGDGLNFVENLTGSNHGDGLSGDDGVNVLRGMDGDDSLRGYGSNDTLYGGSAQDLLDGGAGRDQLYGGADADTFNWSDTIETGLTAATADVVMDFDRASGDLISLSKIDADVYAKGDQAFTFIGTARFSGTPGEVRYYHSDGDTYIEMQTDTSVDVEGVIRLEGIHAPDASWFVL